MKRIFILLLSIITITCTAQTWPTSLKGRWTFDNTSNLLQATVGNNLVLHGTHASIAGPTANDHAVRIDTGSYYHCTHNIAANGSGTPQYVNRYAILIDFRITQIGQWHSFFQTNAQNANDADAFINPNGQIGVGVTGYSTYTVIPGEWYRLVITADLGNHYDYYLDGQLIQNGGAQVLDDRFALMSSSNGNDVLFFADDDGEDNIIDVAQVAIFDTCLTASDIAGLQGFGHVINNTNIKPYLETPTPTSIYINWHNTNTISTKVIYGTDSLALIQSSIGSNIDNGGKRWHTVKLNGLSPNTAYYYRCISGTDTSNIFPFHTPVLPNTAGGHVRFGIVGDSQTNYIQGSLTAVAMRDKFIELYGADWYNKVSFIMHTGDIVGDGSDISAYEREYFNPFSILSCSVPFMISIGNHEAENNYFYNYMHYDDFSTYQYPNQLCERYYTFNLGNVQFLSMNTAGYFDNAAQKIWIKQKLDESSADPDIDFVFAYAHRPGRSEIWPDGNSGYVYDSIYPVFAVYPKVAMHSFGHSHNYEHGTYVANNSQKRDFRTILGGGAGGDLDRWGMYSNQIDMRDVQIAYDYHCYVIVDVDLDTKSYIATMYSLGNPDKPMYNIPLDTWHSVIGRAAPSTPVAMLPQALCADTTPTLIASLFSGADSLMSSQFQITATPGNYNTLLLDTIRDWKNIYGVSVAPYLVPIDKNADIDLRRYTVPPGLLHVGYSYEWRIRYRDHNCRWSEWSQPALINVVTNTNDSIGFVADTTYGNAPLTVHFTDLSNVDATAWLWDFNNDGVFESSMKDPVWTYTSDGIYTVNLIVSYGGNIGNKLKTSYIIVGSNYIKVPLDASEISIFPNPTSQVMQVQLSGNQGVKHLQLYNAMGNLINEFSVTDSANIDVSNLAGGFYFLQIKESGKAVRFVIPK